jgi:hypothetical protein
LLRLKQAQIRHFISHQAFQSLEEPRRLSKDVPTGLAGFEGDNSNNMNSKRAGTFSGACSFYL